MRLSRPTGFRPTAQGRSWRDLANRPPAASSSAKGPGLQLENCRSRRTSAASCQSASSSTRDRNPSSSRAGGKKKEIEARSEQIPPKQEIEKTTSDYDREGSSRNAWRRSQGGSSRSSACLRSATETEDEGTQGPQSDDALHATAWQPPKRGIVPGAGGGVAFLRAPSTPVEARKGQGQGVTRRSGFSRSSPCPSDSPQPDRSPKTPGGRRFTSSSDRDPETTRTPNWGYNAANGEFGDMLKLGIIDPAKVRQNQPCLLQRPPSVSGWALTNRRV